MAARELWKCARKALVTPKKLTPTIHSRCFVEVISSKAPIEKKSRTYTEVEQDISSMQAEMRRAFGEGKYEDALVLANQCKFDVGEHFGEKHPVYASCLNNIALFHKMLGRFDESIETYQEALVSYRETVGEEHASYAMALNNLGAAFKTLADNTKGVEKYGHYESSLECYESTYEIRKKILSEGHPDVTLTLCNIGTLQRHLGKNKEAEVSLLRSLEISKSTVGVKHLVTATIENNVALHYKCQNRFQEAIHLYRSALETRHEILGKKHMDSIMLQNNLAEALLANGQAEEAGQLQKEILDLLDVDHS